jgi:hypothetical protein
MGECVVSQGERGNDIDSPEWDVDACEDKNEGDTDAGASTAEIS